MAYASRVGDDCRHAMTRLDENPRRGRTVPEMNDERLRELLTTKRIACATGGRAGPPFWGQPGARGSRVLAQRGPLTPLRTCFVRWRSGGFHEVRLLIIMAELLASLCVGVLVVFTQESFQVFRQIVSSKLGLGIQGE